VEHRWPRKIQTLLIDDLDGSEAEGTVHFGLSGTEYEIDLHAEHAQASLCAPGICWRAGRERWFVTEAGWPGGRHCDALPRGDLRLFGSAAHSPSIHHPARRRWLPSLARLDAERGSYHFL
jgi:Lsr2